MIDDLEEAIIEGARAVIDSDDHDLPLGLRQAIWSCLGDHASREGPVTLGQIRRHELAKIAVRKVLPFWQKHFPVGKIEEILAKGDDVLAGRLSRSAARKLFEEYQACDESLMSGPESTADAANALLVCAAATGALYVALWDERFSSWEIDSSLPNNSIDAFDFDTALTASIVYANGGPWDKSADPIKRRDFWLWWLKEAVPAAAAISAAPKK
jgi:hypothetical protein